MYFGVLLGTFRYFKVLLDTFMYFEVLLGTLRWAQNNFRGEWIPELSDCLSFASLLLLKIFSHEGPTWQREKLFGVFNSEKRKQKLGCGQSEWRRDTSEKLSWKILWNSVRGETDLVGAWLLLNQMEIDGILSLVVYLAFLDAIASPRTYPGRSVSESVHYGPSP